MLFNNNPFGFGLKINPIVNSLFIQYYSGISSPIPPSELLWVEDGTGQQMVTEDLSQDYIFVGA